MNALEISQKEKILFTVVSFILVTFGQPAWVPLLGVPAALFGYALFWRAMLSLPQKKERFWFATAWFSTVQMVQLSWFLSHPFYYIYAVWLFFSVAVGLQFGLLALLFDPKKYNTLPRILVISACWTLMEWSRIFFLSGYSWNPVGLALAGNIYTVQLASLVGAYGLSFLVILTNLLALRVWRTRYAMYSVALFVAFGIVPFLLGAIHYTYHDAKIDKMEDNPSKIFSVLLVQPSFPVEESLHFTDNQQLLDYVKEEWKQLLRIAAKHQGKDVDLVALPELVVPFGTYTFVYTHEEASRAFEDAFGPEIAEKLPVLELPVAFQVESEKGREWLVNNAWWAQALANIFDANVVIGLEDAEDVEGSREYYSSAIHILPESRRENGSFMAQRYAKRVLVPMGEYIPFSFCRDIAAQYGVYGSFTCGLGAEVWKNDKASYGLSICYEEMFGDMMRENKQRGANFLLNITSDAWFPHSKLVRQHLEHSRLRTIENGFPLVRACNTGVTCVIDSLGRDVAVLGDTENSREEISDALYTTFPLYNYHTLYTRFGDGLILGVSLLILLLFLRYR